MTFYRRSALLRVGLVLIMLLLASLACSLGGDGDDERDSDTEPTIPATITPPSTRTPIPTFTPFPSWTPSQGIQPLPTATRIVLNPTSPPLPTWTPISPTPYPYDVRISYPVSGSQVAGYLTIVGSASHPRFLQYALEWGPHPNPTNLWYPLTGPQRRPVINGALGAWNTSLSADGVYQIRLHVWLNDGTETFAVVSAIRLSNTTPTAVPTLTLTPRPNRVPVLNPIPSQQLEAGETVDIDVTTSDPDGDPVNLFVASSNASIASSTVVSPSRISVTGVTAGSATVTVTANDGRGGLTSTAFIVTVEGQNQAPTISPLLNQELEVGQSRDLALSASDPDGDTLTVTARSDDETIANVSVPDLSTVQIAGVAEGTANVTVTADDGKGGQISTTFQVDVGAVNMPPTIDPVPAQTMSVGDTLDVSFTAVDPDGDTLNAVASSDTESVVSASVTGSGTIRLVANAEGTATVTLSVDDGVNPASIVTFNVTVALGNLPPTVDTIGPQTMGVGETRDVGYNATDPDNDPLNAIATSDNGAVVAASVTSPGVIGLVANGAGTATVTLSVDDGVNPAVEVSFTVSVAAVNLPPTVETIFPQTLNVGDTVEVSYSATDPENDPLNAMATSDNEGVVFASVTGTGVITLIGNSEGSATVTLTVNDGNNAPVSQPFSVTVTAVNEPPNINPISPQTLNMGDTLDVPYTATDPENDSLNAVATSDNESVVFASVTGPGTINLVGNAAGTATVTLRVDDGVNPAVSAQFGVTVNAANQSPSISPISPQALNVGDTLDVPYTATDPENDPLNAVATSDNEGVVFASVTGPGTINLVGNAAGTAMVTLQVDDGVNPAVSTQFAVTVNVANANPVIQPIAGQTVDAGASLSVPVVVTDPDGDPVTLMAVSDNPGVATAMANGPAEVVVTGVAPGTANVIVDADDGKGGTASVTFLVTVAGVNNPPVIQPIADQVVPAGEQIPIAISVSDADNDPLVVTALSQNTGVATASAVGTDTVLVDGVAPGVTSIDVTADDARGGVVTVSFNVTVSSVEPPFDLMAYPVIPDIPSAMASSLAQVYQSGVNNFGNQGGAFSRIGDETMEGPNFMAPFAGDTYDLAGYSSLQALIDLYRATSVRPAIDPAINSFNVDSVAAGPDYGIDALSGVAPAGPPCEGVGGTLLSCELQVTRPAIALISFSAPNVTYMTPDQFRSELQYVVSEALSTHGVIPVLATIPAGGGYTADQLADYNRVIVEVATQSGVAGVPLWNLARAMQERGIADPNSVAPAGPGNLSEGALSYGYNIRNLTALQTLQAVRQAASIP